MRNTTTLEEIRVNNNLSQVEAAKIAGVDKETWNRIENGQTKSPRRTTLVKIAKAFNIDVDDIVTREEKEKAEQANKEELISVQSLELVNYTADQIKDETAKNVFLYELAVELQKFFKINDKCLWVNVNTGTVARDKEFKMRRIDQAITICNNDQTKSVGDELRKMLQYPRWWKHIELTNDANRKENHPLALLGKAVKGLKLKEDKDALINEALQAEQTTESYLDYDNTEYVYDKIYYETDKQFREGALEDALETWNDDRDLNVESGYSFYDILEQCNDSTDLEPFWLVEEEKGFENPFDPATEVWGYYQDYLDKEGANRD
ncbi:helix-turn-helix domain-containing protein [Lactobacillus kitasatonis]|uniref:helix-turn-helix domain-containing protein n=1 Tax=Lactobacillus kitasatonis TaxID=237446 RepID=UPI003F662050